MPTPQKIIERRYRTSGGVGDWGAGGAYVDAVEGYTYAREIALNETFRDDTSARLAYYVYPTASEQLGDEEAAVRLGNDTRNQAEFLYYQKALVRDPSDDPLDAYPRRRRNLGETKAVLR